MSGSDTGALWGGRFDSGMDASMVPLNLSLDVDQRLWQEDIQGSEAWARAIGRAGVLTEAEVEAILHGLDRVRERLANGAAREAGDEDIHSLVERLLGEEAGEVAGKLHTGRSRNDQVATDLRLWGMKAAQSIAEGVAEVERALLELAEQGMEVIMPGYTHLQQGQPIRGAHWAMAHLWPLERDRARLEAVHLAASVLPLGSGAVAGCPFPIDREALAADLGFLRISENSLDAVSDRDWALELLSATALIGLHLSRLAEDLVLFSSREFGFLRLSDGFSTGSSLMPQKRNPDVAELTRGRTGRLAGAWTSLFVLLKGLPTGYNRDLQEDKVPLFQAADSLAVVLPAVAGAIRTAEFNPGRIHDALDSALLATDLADYLVRKGVPFRQCHEAVGILVRMAEKRGCSVEDLGDQDFAQAHPAFGEDVRKVFDMQASVEARSAAGGTARAAVQAQMDEARARLS